MSGTHSEPVVPDTYIQWSEAQLDEALESLADLLNAVSGEPGPQHDRNDVAIRVVEDPPPSLTVRLERALLKSEGTE